MPKTYTISEAADKLGLAPKTLRRWEKAGKFKAQRTKGGQRRYTTEDIQILDAIKNNLIEKQADLLTLKKAANYFNISPQTLSRWESEGKLHPFTTSQNTYYPKPRLKEIIPKLKQKLQPEPQPDEPKPKPKTQPQPQPSSQPQDQKLSSLKDKTQQKAKTPLTRTLLITTLVNLTITLLLIFGYHQLTNQSPLSPEQGSVKGTSQTTSPLLQTLQNLFDQTGNLTTPGSITTQNSLSVGKTLSLAPQNLPQNATPGTIYYDASTQTLKLYSQGSWQSLPAPKTLKNPQDTLAIQGTGSLQKSSTQSTIQDENITPKSSITLTFQADYSPAKKYWLTQKTGQFTVHTDFPPGRNVPFTYLILEKTQASPSPTPTPSPSPSPSPTPSAQATESAETSDSIPSTQQ